MCLLGNLDRHDEVQLGGEVDGVGEEVGVLHVVEVGDGVPVHHVLVLVGRVGVGVAQFPNVGDPLGPLAHFGGGVLHLVFDSVTGGHHKNFSC